MKICIVTTPIRPTPTRFPPLGSMAIVQSLRNNGEEVHFYNIDYHRYNHQQIYEHFQNNTYDAVGISAVVSTAYAYSKYLTDLIKKNNKNTVVFLGGGLAASAEILHKKANVDYCVVGDGELIVKNLINTIKANQTSDETLSKIKGITFIDKHNALKFTGYEHPLPAPLLESPDYNILEEDNSIDHYINDTGGKRFDPDNNDNNVNLKTATIVVAKGCVARCTFCHRFEKGYRVQPFQKVINFIKTLKKKYNVGYLGIGDENFGAYKKETTELVDEFGKLGLSWTAGGVRAHTVDLDMLKHWKKNGCDAVIFGIESGSPRMLRVMEKKITLEQNINALKNVYEAKLSTVVQLVIGMPGESDITIGETIDFLKKTLKYYPDGLRKKISYTVSINYAQALPGTPLYEYARENEYLGKSMEQEEKYLLDISDKDAYDNDHFINYTKQPLLKVFTWRHRINWEMFREHAKVNLKINLSKIKILSGMFLMVINKFFKINIKSSLETELNKFKDEHESADYYNYAKRARLLDGLRLLLPWNSLTYPFLCIIIAYYESDSIKWFFKLIIEHILWNSKKFNPNDLPDITLRKIVNITDTDDSLELRKGR